MSCIQKHRPTHFFPTRDLDLNCFFFEIERTLYIHSHAKKWAKPLEITETKLLILGKIYNFRDIKSVTLKKFLGPEKLKISLLSFRVVILWFNCILFLVFYSIFPNFGTL